MEEEKRNLNFIQTNNQTCTKEIALSFLSIILFIQDVLTLLGAYLGKYNCIPIEISHIKACGIEKKNEITQKIMNCRILYH